MSEGYYIQPYRFHLPKGGAFEDEYENWIERSYTSRRHEGYYQETERDYEDDQIPSVPNGSYLDDIPLDNTVEI